MRVFNFFFLQEDLNNETLASQFEIIKQETIMSHVMHYGDLKIAEDYVAYYLGDRISNVTNTHNDQVYNSGIFEMNLEN